MMEPNRATDMPATIMVFVPVPSHTINSGARADFGRLFKITRYGSKISESFVEYHSSVALIKLMRNTKRKLRRVSQRVMPM